MKRILFIIILTFTAVISAIETASSSTPTNDVTLIAVYVRVDEASSSPLKFVGNYDLTVGTKALTVLVIDTRPNPDVRVARIGRDISGTPILVEPETIIITNVTIP